MSLRAEDQLRPHFLTLSEYGHSHAGERGVHTAESHTRRYFTWLCSIAIVLTELVHTESMEKHIEQTAEAIYKIFHLAVTMALPELVYLSQCGSCPWREWCAVTARSSHSETHQQCHGTCTIRVSGIRALIITCMLASSPV